MNKKDEVIIRMSDKKMKNSTNNINYNLRIHSEFALPNVRCIFHGSESVLYLDLKSEILYI